MDCSALVAASIIRAGMNNPKTGSGVNGTKNGVALIVGNSRVSSLEKIRGGDAVTFRSGRSNHQGPNGIYDHIGIVSDLVYVDGKLNKFGYHIFRRPGISIAFRKRNRKGN